MDVNKENQVNPITPMPEGSTPNINYDFNFQNQIKEAEQIVPVQPEIPVVPQVVQTTSQLIPDPAIGQVNPNPVSVENVVPVSIDTAAGIEINKEIEKPVPVTPTQSAIKTSGTATEEELVIDASKEAPEVLDEYAITMDAAAEKKKQKSNNVFIGIVFGVIIIFIILLRVIISIIGY